MKIKSETGYKSTLWAVSIVTLICYINTAVDLAMWLIRLIANF